MEQEQEKKVDDEKQKELLFRDVPFYQEDIPEEEEPSIVKDLSTGSPSLGYIPEVPHSLFKTYTLDLLCPPVDLSEIKISKRLIILDLPKTMRNVGLDLGDWVIEVEGERMRAVSQFDAIAANMSSMQNLKTINMKVRRSIKCYKIGDPSNSRHLPTGYETIPGYSYLHAYIVMYPESRLGMKVRNHNDKLYICAIDSGWNSLAWRSLFVGDCVVKVDDYVPVRVDEATSYIAQRLVKRKYIHLIIERPETRDTVQRVESAIRYREMRMIDPEIRDDDMEMMMRLVGNFLEDTPSELAPIYTGPTIPYVEELLPSETKKPKKKKKEEDKSGKKKKLPKAEAEVGKPVEVDNANKPKDEGSAISSAKSKKRKDADSAKSSTKKPNPKDAEDLDKSAVKNKDSKSKKPNDVESAKSSKKPVDDSALKNPPDADKPEENVSAVKDVAEKPKTDAKSKIEPEKRPKPVKSEIKSVPKEEKIAVAKPPVIPILQMDTEDIEVDEDTEVPSEMLDDEVKEKRDKKKEKEQKEKEKRKKEKEEKRKKEKEENQKKSPAIEKKKSPPKDDEKKKDPVKEPEKKKAEAKAKDSETKKEPAKAAEEKPQSPKEPEEPSFTDESPDAEAPSEMEIRAPAVQPRKAEKPHVVIDAEQPVVEEMGRRTRNPLSLVPHVSASSVEGRKMMEKRMRKKLAQRKRREAEARAESRSKMSGSAKTGRRKASTPKSPMNDGADSNNQSTGTAISSKRRKPSTSPAPKSPEKDDDSKVGSGSAKTKPREKKSTSPAPKSSDAENAGAAVRSKPSSQSQQGSVKSKLREKKSSSPAPKSPDEESKVANRSKSSAIISGRRKPSTPPPPKSPADDNSKQSNVSNKSAISPAPKSQASESENSNVATPTKSPRRIASTPSKSPRHVASTPSKSPRRVGSTPSKSPRRIATARHAPSSGTVRKQPSQSPKPRSQPSRKKPSHK